MVREGLLGRGVPRYVRRSIATRERPEHRIDRIGGVQYDANQAAIFCGEVDHEAWTNAHLFTETLRDRYHAFRRNDRFRAFEV